MTETIGPKSAPKDTLSLNDLDAAFNIKESSQPNAISLENEQAKFSVHPIAKQREDARVIISLIIVLSLAFIVIATFVSLWTKGNTPVDDIVKVIGAITAPVIGIVGAVTGFYFGESRGDSR
jgi:hypothetical protein